MPLTANSLIYYNLVNFILKAKLLTNYIIENFILFYIITNKSFNLYFNTIFNKNWMKRLLLIYTTLTRYYIKGN
jgi:hypothetical protein